MSMRFSTLRTLGLSILLTISLMAGTMHAALAVAPGIGCGETDGNTQGVLPGCENNTPENAVQEGRDFFETTLPNIINWSIGIIGLIAMGFLVKGGISFIISLGDDGKMKAAVKTISAAAIGLFVAMLSYILVQVVSTFNFFG